MVCCLAAALLAATCSPPAAPSRPDIVVYLCDTLRADHLGAYGYERETSPNIDRLAADSIVFERALAPSSWTKASTASLLTGLYPTQHNANDRDSRLPGGIKLLSERLQELGYHTIGIITNPFVSNTFGFKKGYDEFEFIGRAVAEELIVRVNAALDARPKDKPLFLYVHSIDPHSPYSPPAPHKQAFTKTPSIGVPDSLSPASTVKQLRAVIDSYDSEILYHDLSFGELVDRLKSDGIYDDCMFWLVSDHGDEFAEHGRGGHGRQLFDESLHIPMILKLPGNQRAGKRVTALSSLIDVVPTVMGYLGEFPPDESEGLDLLVDIDERETRLPYFLHLDLMVEQLFVSNGVISGDYKYIEEMLPLQRSFLFNIKKDPREKNNLIHEQPRIAAELAMLVKMHEQGQRAGLTLRLVGEEHTKVRAVLRTAGKFTGVDSLEVEENDTATIDETGQVLTLNLALDEFESNIGKLRTSDIDTFTLHLEPSDAEVTVELLEVEGVKGDFPLFLGLDRAIAPVPHTLEPKSPELLTADLGLLFRKERTLASKAKRGQATQVEQPPAGLYVVALEAIESEDIASMPQDVRDQLEELGYLGSELEEEPK